jgi:hypothetical protein
MAIQDFTAGQILTAAQMDALQANDYNQTVSTKTDDYVLVAADKGTRVVMNSATAKTVTVNSGLFAAGDTLFIQNIGVGTCTITAGTCTVTTASSLALGTWAGGTLYFTSASAAIFFSGGGATYGTATGGTSSSITVGGINYTLLSFTSSSLLTVTKSGLFDVLMFAGGGCGGTGATNGAVGGGGGAGGVLEETIYLDANASITIGAGGATGYPWTEGSSSTVGNAARNLSVAGGGKGGGYITGLASIQGSMGGSGGGGAGNTGQAFAHVANPSMAPGISGHSGAANNGGGGGATANASTTTGGAGYDVSAFIGGSTVTKGTGGNGNTVAGTNGAANSADGGGGGPTGNNTGYGSGGSGIVYIRFKV